SNHQFKDVRMTLTSTDNGKNWQVSNITDGGNNDYSKYNWMLALLCNNGLFFCCLITPPLVVRGGVTQ
ncbi:MAG: hypothetical protein II198_00140, partial [Bacteroidaceae bacterium]|nr:hypothetical protein [Bacteroidaceae bacterium]